MCIVLIVAIGIQLVGTFHLLWNSSPQSTAFTERMVIDGDSYRRGADAMIESGSWIISPDRFHSVGMQITVAGLTRLFSPSPLVLWTFNFVCLLVALFCLTRLCFSVGLSPRRALLAALLVASSIAVRSFVATTQYEIIATALIAGLALLVHNGRYISGGVVMAILLVFRFHFAPALLPIVWWAWRMGGRSALRRVVGASTGLVLAIYFAYSLHFGDWNGYQVLPPNHFDKWQCLGAKGFNFPYFATNESSVCGWRFVTEHPLEFSLLLGKRFLYWIGWLPDVWTMSWGPGWLEKVCTMIVTVVVTSAAFARASAPHFRALALSITFSFAPFLIAGASYRFLLPFLPFAMLLTVAHGQRGSVGSAPQRPTELQFPPQQS